MSNKSIVPFNDLSRIHKPLLEEFTRVLVRTVETSSLVLGDEVSSFENEISQFEGCKFAIGVNNGTSAIELSLRALDIGVGDEVITTAFTFVATCFSILQTGAVPVLVDIDPLTGLLDPSKIETAISPRTRAVVFVTLHGRIENLQLIQDICKRNNLFFIIDAAQSHLGTFNNKPQTEFCDVATLSFYPGKNLGALGEGGAVLTNSMEVSNRIKAMRDWGATQKYSHDVWGGNFRLESLQAAFLRIKLRELKKWTSERQRIGGIYRQELNQNLLMDPIQESGSHVYHIYSVVITEKEKFCDSLTQSGIGFGFHYPKAIHQQQAYMGKVLQSEVLTNSEWLASRTVSIPIFPGQTDLEIEATIETVNSIAKKI